MSEPLHIVLIGACAIDVILSVPHYPSEDSKLRATSMLKRRGGNTPNTMEVLHQLIELDQKLNQRAHLPELSLIATLPAQHASSIPFVANSFTLPDEMTHVDLSHCVYREEHDEPITSHIISSTDSGARTIINHNELPEMTFDEFRDRAQTLLDSAHRRTPMPRLWFHFEGRIPEVTLKCIQHLRGWRKQKGLDSSCITVSVELEKPQREGLQQLAHEADFVFYSKSWAEGENYWSAEECMARQFDTLDWDHVSGRHLICPWGDQGAVACHANKHIFLYEPLETVHSPAHADAVNGRIVDAVGAGDTFIAGMLFSVIFQPDRNLRQNLDFANALAGRKILQSGFDRLAEQVQDFIAR